MSAGPRRRAVLAGGLLGAAGLGTTLMTAGCTDRPEGTAGSGRAPGTASTAAGAPEQVSADVALRWADHYLSIVLQSGLPPPSAAQMLAELGVVLQAASRVGTGVAITADADPAVRSGTTAAPRPGERGALHELALPEGRSGLDAGLVADAALTWLLVRRYVDTAGPALLAAAEDADRALEAASPKAREAARDAGEAIGAAVLDWTLGVLTPTTSEPVPRLQPVGPGSWVSTPPDYEQPVLPLWGRMRTVVVPRVVEPDDPAPFSTEVGSLFRTGVEEVRDTVAALTPEQLAVAEHWSDGKWTVNPAGHWLRIVQAALRAQDADLATAAEAVLRLGLSQHDAFVSCWWTKYHTDVLRPVTYIRSHLGEPEWLPPISTPCFPEYTSGHATQSAAAAAALAAVLPDGPFTDATEPARPPRSFASMREAAQEAAVSRLYGGIHYRASNDAGLECGYRVGTAVAELELRT